METAMPAQVKVAKKAKTKRRAVDFSRYKQRHIALKFTYLGWNYSGLVLQKDTTETVMERLVQALAKTQMVESQEKAVLTCCGRTDKGVSAAGQVVSLFVRSLLSGSPDVGFVEDSGPNISQRPEVPVKEMDYVFLLNRVLPPDIRVVAWAPAAGDFSARFSCKERTYKYLFPRGDLDLEAMQEAAQLFLGEHDFRNFCKMTPDVVNYVRCVRQVGVECVRPHASDRGRDMLEATVRGTAFLYHQIRCMMTVLLLVGSGRERPQIVSELLDVQTSGAKPQYERASELPLVFFRAEFDDLDWRISAEAKKDLRKSFQKLWTSHALRFNVVDLMMKEVVGDDTTEDSDASGLTMFMTGDLNRRHVPLLKRLREDTLETRLHKAEAKRKRKEEAS